MTELWWADLIISVGLAAFLAHLICVVIMRWKK